MDCLRVFRVRFASTRFRKRAPSPPQPASRVVKAHATPMNVAAAIGAGPKVAFKYAVAWPEKSYAGGGTGVPGALRFSTRRRYTSYSDVLPKVRRFLTTSP